MPRLLYICPAWPQPTGSGLAMRAYRMLQALTYRYRVSLLTTVPQPVNAESRLAVSSLCQSVTTIPTGRWAAATLPRRLLRRVHHRAYHAWYGQPTDWQVVTPGTRATLARTYAETSFDLVHVHRLYMSPVWQALPERLAETPAQLDFDDWESVTHYRLAALARRNGNTRLAGNMQRDADAYRRIERRELMRFTRVFVCSKTDQAHLMTAEPRLAVTAIPNVVDVPDLTRQSEPGAADPFVFLFVGSLAYYPNRDAVTFFCRDVAPLIRSQGARPFEIRVVSSGSERDWLEIPMIPEIRRAPLSGALADEYHRADAVIVPIRAGGGTRIKTIEAFSFGKPVIATSIGIEGLEVQDGEHALVGDAPADLASHCLRVMRDSILRTRLAGRGYALVEGAHNPRALRLRLDEVDGLASEQRSTGGGEDA